MMRFTSKKGRPAQCTPPVAAQADSLPGRAGLTTMMSAECVSCRTYQIGHLIIAAAVAAGAAQVKAVSKAAVSIHDEADVARQRSAAQQTSDAAAQPSGHGLTPGLRRRRARRAHDIGGGPTRAWSQQVATPDHIRKGWRGSYIRSTPIRYAACCWGGRTILCASVRPLDCVKPHSRRPVCTSRSHNMQSAYRPHERPRVALFATLGAGLQWDSTFRLVKRCRRAVEVPGRRVRHSCGAFGVRPFARK